MKATGEAMGTSTRKRTSLTVVVATLSDLVLLVAAVGACEPSPGEPYSAPSNPARPPVALVRLFDDEVFYGQSADGRVWGGYPDLSSQVDDLDGTTSITGGGSDSTILGSPPESWQCAVVADGTVTCEGSNLNGDLDPLQSASCDNPNNECAPQPCLRLFGPTSYACVAQWTALPEVAGIVQVHGSCGVEGDGNVVCWGNAAAPTFPGPVRQLVGAFALLQNGDLFDLSYGLTGLHDVIDASGSSEATACAVTSDNALWCWGSNANGTVGDGTTQDAAAPEEVGQGFQAVETGETTTCGLRTDGTVECWGMVAPDEGDAGVGVSCLGGLARCKTSPQRVAQLSNVVQIADVIEAQFYALLSDGSVVNVSLPPEAPTIATVHPSR